MPDATRRWQSQGVHILIDPDRWDAASLARLLTSVPPVVTSIVVGGTYIHSDHFRKTVDLCLSAGLPVGNIVSAGPFDSQISDRAEFVLLPILMGSVTTRFVLDHVIQSAPVIRRNRQIAVSLAYLMLAGEGAASATYFTQALPIPRGKPEIIETLCLAAGYLGVSGVYLEAGSGARVPVTPEEVQAARKATDIPVLVGGGIDSCSLCSELLEAGANGLIIGSSLEARRDASWLAELPRRSP